MGTSLGLAAQTRLVRTPNQRTTAAGASGEAMFRHACAMGLRRHRVKASRQPVQERPVLVLGEDQTGLRTAVSYSITSSACACSASGTSMPSPFAALRLMISL